MKKLIYKTLLFVAPFLLLFCFNSVFYKQNKGDLIRLGYIYSNPVVSSTLSVLYKEHSREKKYDFLAIAYPDLNDSYDFLSIGDSFSAQKEAGYQNRLAYNNKSLLNVDFTLLGMNPIQALSELANGDFFDKVKPQYVILETVQRYAVGRCRELDLNKSILFDDIQGKITDFNLRDAEPRKFSFFSRDMLDLLILNISYLFVDKPKLSAVYKTDTTQHFFSVKKKNLLFYCEDYQDIHENNEFDNARLVVDSINALSDRLSKKGITLIFVIAPDKYTAYYPYIYNKGKYEEPLFFKNYEKLEKRYIDIPAYSILTDAIERGEKDIYFYEDTHWSPIAAKYVAEEISQIIEER